MFRIEAGRPLPKVNEESVVQYREYLVENLLFPFDAQFYDDHEGAVCDHLVTATRLLEAREALYAAVADLSVDTVGRTPEQVADEGAIHIERLGA